MKSGKADGGKGVDADPVKRTSEKPGEEFLVAAVGASAGGVEAFSELMRALPPDTGMSFVLIQHLDPKHHSILSELVSRETAMRVAEVTDGMRLDRNCVYVIPPNTAMTLSDHTLKLTSRVETAGGHMPIDQFMRSLAEEQGPRAIGVILSGLGSDGTLGLAEIQAGGGVTFAQQESTAKYDAMPRSAIASGHVDYILPPKKIAQELARIAAHPYVERPPTPEVAPEPRDNSSLYTIFQLLRRATGLDFTHYRQTTILRRIQRRMIVHKIKGLEDYARYVQTNPAEVKALYHDVLINVTSFFRNPGVFEAMKEMVFPHLITSQSQESAVRIWTPGCSSGEETYSLAIAMLEYMGERSSQTSVQSFGTDVSENAIVKARAGLYPKNIQGDVSAERLRRFFTEAEGGYRINKAIRDMCIFAQQNVLSDPPFSQMDIICCRNLLIYLEPVLQSKVISLFHYALKPNGYLILGTSEGVGTAANLFSVAERNQKIFAKRAAGARQVVTFSLNPQAERTEYGPLSTPLKPSNTAWSYPEVQKEFDRRLLLHHVPPAVFVDDNMEIIHTRGNVSRFLKLATGRASLNITKMAREGLLFDLRNAIARAKKENKPVRKQNVAVKNGSEHDGQDAPKDYARFVNFEVVPLQVGTLNQQYLMILFEEAHPEAMPTPVRAPSGKKTGQLRRENARLAKLEQELTATKEYLESVIETHEATNEELQAANEEILSSNEELQSTNEELETAKEELQSANEELTTVNDELRSRNADVSQINNDLMNLFACIDTAVVMVSSDLTIRRFTPRAEKLMGLIPADLGRPFWNINPNVEAADLQQMLINVIASNRSVERDITDRNGISYHVRVLPYRTNEGSHDGAVITMTDELPLK